MRICFGVVILAPYTIVHPSGDLCVDFDHCILFDIGLCCMGDPSIRLAEIGGFVVVGELDNLWVYEDERSVGGHENEGDATYAHERLARVLCTVEKPHRY